MTTAYAPTQQPPFPDWPVPVLTRREAALSDLDRWDDAIQELNAALRDADTDVRHAAATALKKIRIRSASA